MTKYFGLLFCLFFVACGHLYMDNKYSIEYINNSPYTIGVWGNITFDTLTDYPDTSLYNNVNCDFFEVASKTSKMSNGGLSVPFYEFVRDALYADTVSFFIIHTDTLVTNDCESIKQQYKILQRYDFSSEDLKKLTNKYGTATIPYPPIEEMKNMKMYPPYGTNNINNNIIMK